jgi:pyridoxamine 5'-phosphate oxidase
VPDLIRMRRDYDDGGLGEDRLAPSWVEQFDRWFADAVAAELPEPNAMVVATADADGAPDARVVLMKGYDADGVVFGTNYASAKGAQLAVNPRAALVFPWHALQRQVRLTGAVQRPPPMRCGTRAPAARSWPPRRPCSRRSSTPATSWSSGYGSWTR